MDQFASLDHDMSETSQQLQQINKSLGKKIELMTELTNDFQHRSKKIDPIDLDRLLQEEERNLLQKLINYLKFDSRSYSLPAPRLDKFSSFLTRLCAERETVLNELEAETRQLEQQRDARNLSFEADAAKWSQLNKERKLVVQELNDEKKLCNFLSKKFNVQYRKLNEKGELPIGRFPFGTRPRLSGKNEI